MVDTLLFRVHECFPTAFVDTSSSHCLKRCGKESIMIGSEVEKSCEWRLASWLTQ